jgi:hypothetical protein
VCKCVFEICLFVYLLACMLAHLGAFVIIMIMFIMHLPQTLIYSLINVSCADDLQSFRIRQLSFRVFVYCSQTEYMFVVSAHTNRGASYSVKIHCCVETVNKTGNVRIMLRGKAVSITFFFVCVRVPRRVGVYMRVRACSLAYPACIAYAPYCDVICGPSGSTTFFDIIS